MVYTLQDEVNIGVVCSDLTEKNGDILVEWFNSKERSSERRCTSSYDQLRIRLKEPAVFGFYSPECLPALVGSAGVVDVEEKPQASLPEPTGLFSHGDRVMVDPGINQKGFEKHVSIYLIKINLKYLF